MFFHKTHNSFKLLISQIISIQDELCVRGYWSIPDDVSKPNVLDWFEKQIKSIGISNLKETFYLPQIEGSNYLNFWNWQIFFGIGRY